MTAEVTTTPKPEAPTVVQRWFPIAAWLPTYQRTLMHFTNRFDELTFLACLHQHAPEPLEADGILGELGENRIYDNVREAVAAVTAPTHEEA